MQIPHTKRTLSNGLDVIVHEDHQLPMVAVNIWYHVGSKNERPGRTGFAHLFEHLMFEGSEHHDHGYFPPLQRAGGLLNGSTNADRTNYWEVVPTGALDLALWMESDRMGYLLPALSEKKFTNQRDVVLNERRQNYENRPYGLAGMALSSAMFPPDHPYHWPTIGSAEDLRAASLDQVREFFQTYYHPGNASLSLAGDIETEQAFELAETVFRRPSRRPEGRAGARGRATGDEREPRARGSRRAAAPVHQLAFAGDVCERRCGARHRGRRAGARQDVAPLQNAGLRAARSRPTCRRISIRAKWAACSRLPARRLPGSRLPELHTAILAAVAELAATVPPIRELERGLAQTEAQFIYRLQTVGGFGGKGDQLNAYNTFAGDPGYFERDRQRYFDVTSNGAAAAVGKWLRATRRRFRSAWCPKGRRDLALAGAAEVHVS